MTLFLAGASHKDEETGDLAGNLNTPLPENHDESIT